MDPNELVNLTEKDHNIVRNWITGKILYKTYNGLGDACDWMMSRINMLDIENTSADEILADGTLGGSWFISDLLENNKDGWELEDGTIIIGRIDDNTGAWVIERRHK